MESVSLKLIMLSLVALFSLSGCESSTSSSTDRALGTVQQEPQRSAANAMSPTTNEQRQQDIELQAIKLYPVDEGIHDSSFAEFRNKLLKAATDHDATFIESILDPEIVNSSDGERGVKEFKKQWNLDQPDGKLWEALMTILSMGGSFRINEENREFCAPYVTSQWPNVVRQLPKGADPLDYQVVTEKSVAIRSAPNPTAPIVAHLSYDVVKVQSGQVHGSTNWLKIRTLAGKEGYVPDKYIRGPSDYQACFKKVGEKWFMTELAARE